MYNVIYIIIHILYILDKYYTEYNMYHTYFINNYFKSFTSQYIIIKD